MESPLIAGNNGDIFVLIFLPRAQRKCWDRMKVAKSSVVALRDLTFGHARHPVWSQPQLFSRASGLSRKPP